jgi:hypothetical protein
MKEQLENIERLTEQSSFRGDDLVTIKNLYTRYINNNHNICMNCPGSINQMINVFKAHKEIMIRKIYSENPELIKDETEDDGED